MTISNTPQLSGGRTVRMDANIWPAEGELKTEPATAADSKPLNVIQFKLILNFQSKIAICYKSRVQLNGQSRVNIYIFIWISKCCSQIYANFVTLQTSVKVQTFANEAGGEWFVAASTSRNDGNFARGDSGLRWHKRQVKAAVDEQRLGASFYRWLTQGRQWNI